MTTTPIYRQYLHLGYPPTCRLRDWPTISRLYPPDLPPSKAELLKWYHDGLLIPSTSHPPTSHRDHWKYIDVHATLHRMGYHPDQLPEPPHNTQQQ